MTLQEVLAAGCDSRPFLQGIQLYVNVVDSLGGDLSIAEQEALLERAGAPFLHRAFTEPIALARQEQHDCQRLISVNDAREKVYGPLVGIYPEQSISGLPGPNGGVVASIYSFTDEEFRSLGLRGSGLYCLWMQSQGSDRFTDSKVFRAPNQDDNCAGASPPSRPADYTTLTTTPRTISTNAAPPHRYPTTARWMWRDEDNAQFIGIRCGQAFCELTPSGTSTVSADYPEADSVSGWFDRQYVGWFPPDAGTLVPSDLMGTFAPAEGVQQATFGQQRSALIREGGLPAAIITLEGSHDAARAFYATNLDLDWHAPNQLVSVDTIRVRVFPDPDPSKQADPDFDQWRGWTTAREIQRPLQLAVDHPHSGLRTVRWRWSENDERGWLPCRHGCCTWYDS